VTHASRLSSALAKIKEDETSEKSIETQDRKSQPSKCKICKEVFMSRNALFKHLDEKHRFCRVSGQQAIKCASLKDYSPATCQRLSDGCGLLTGDDQIDSFAVFGEQDKAAIAPPSPRYTFPRAASTRVVVVGTTVHHSDSVECISAQHKHIHIEPTRLYYLPICMTNIKIICHIQ